MPHAVITGMIRTVLAAAQEFNLNSQTSVSKELVRMLKLNFKLIDVVQFVAPESCEGALRPPKHPFELSLEPIQVQMSQLPIVIDHPIQPRPGQVAVIDDGVVNFLALAVEELGETQSQG